MSTQQRWYSETGNYYYTQEQIDEQNEIVSVYRAHDDSPVGEPFKTHGGCSHFVTLANKEWFVSGRHYMLQLFLDLESGRVSDDVLNEEESEDYQDGTSFIWCAPAQSSPDPRVLLVDGCIWALPYEWRLFDVRDVSRGWPELSLWDCVEWKAPDHPVKAPWTDSNFTRMEFLEGKLYCYDAKHGALLAILNYNKLLT